MGRANQKPRKGKQHQHLAKVGSRPDLEHEGAKERAAVMDVMGLGNLSSGARNVFFWIAALILVAGIVALVILTAL